jgi:hypothetical protein
MILAKISASTFRMIFGRCSPDLEDVCLDLEDVHRDKCDNI